MCGITWADVQLCNPCHALVCCNMMHTRMEAHMHRILSSSIRICALNIDAILARHSSIHLFSNPYLHTGIHFLLAGCSDLGGDQQNVGSVREGEMEEALASRLHRTGGVRPRTCQCMPGETAGTEMQPFAM